uniref:Uncharacterized protein n=1 Tax=Romanomermis culicivorax TaxID=13658 RepID=A0A915HJH2_ROMCU
MLHTVREFDENLPRYRCLLNTVHVKTGVFLIGVSHLVALLYMVCLQSGIWNYSKSMHFKENNYTSFVYNVPTFTSSALLGFNVAAIICLMHAIMTLKPQYLIPLLILLVCSVVYFLISTVVIILALSTNEQSLLNFIRIQIKWASGEEWPFQLSDRAFKRDVLPLLTPAVFAFLGAIVVDLHFVNRAFGYMFHGQDDQTTNEADDVYASAPPPTYEEAVFKKA